MKNQNVAIVEILETELVKIERLRKQGATGNQWIVILESDDSIMLHASEGKRRPRLSVNRNVLEMGDVLKFGGKREAINAAREIGRNARAIHLRDRLRSEEQRIKQAIQRATFGG